MRNEQKAEKTVPVSFQGILQMPVFTTNGGNHEMGINIPEMQERLLNMNTWEIPRLHKLQVE